MMIYSFTGEYRWLSNFHECIVPYDDMDWPSSEHAFMAAKTHDWDDKNKILVAKTPTMAKRLGRSVVLRPDWEEVKLGIMYEVVLSKFTNNLDIQVKLIGTGDRELIEGNTWGDKFWGQVSGDGENHLGRILMRIRSEIG